MDNEELARNLSEMFYQVEGLTPGQKLTLTIAAARLRFYAAAFSEQEQAHEELIERPRAC